MLQTTAGFREISIVTAMTRTTSECNSFGSDGPLDCSGALFCATPACADVES